MLVVGLMERTGKLDMVRLLDARHIKEIAESVESTSPVKAGGSRIKVARTSLGIQLSQGKIEAGEGEGARERLFFTVSSSNGNLDHKTAVRLARLLGQLTHRGRALRVLPTQSGAFHIME
jgi:hypothetical protein